MKLYIKDVEGNR